jgi:hypothetical protein
MKPRAYLETSFVSYVVGRLSRDVIALANQELTRDWWIHRREEYELFVSEIVVREIAAVLPTWLSSALISSQAFRFWP